MGKIYITENNCVLNTTILEKWKQLLDRYHCLYVYAMTGIGKTTIAMELAANYYDELNIFSADTNTFIEEVEDYINKDCSQTKQTLIILDDLHWIKSAYTQHRLGELIRSTRGRSQNVFFALLSRASLPTYLNPLYLTKQLAIDGKQSLWLNREQVDTLLKVEQLSAYQGKAEHEYLIDQCLAITQGYPIGIQSFLNQIREGKRDFNQIRIRVRKELFDYFDHFTATQWDEAMLGCLIRLAVFPEFDLNMARAIVGEKAMMVMENINEISSVFDECQAGHYTFHEFFLKFLRYKLHKLPKNELQNIYHNGGKCYESRGDYNNAVSCYKEAGEMDKVAELAIILIEAVDSRFVRNCDHCLESIDTNTIEESPKMWAAKALLYSYKMKMEKSNSFLEKLKLLAEQERKTKSGRDIQNIYVRTLISLPHGNSLELLEKMKYLPGYVIKSGHRFDNILPTGNMPSVINGGLDLTNWAKNAKRIYPMMKKAVETAFGKEAIGLAEVCMGEIFYEKADRITAMEYLTKGYETALTGGNIRIQYTATSIMMRVLQSEGRNDKAVELLEKVKEQALKSANYELLENIEATIVNSILLNGNGVAINKWLEDAAPDEYAPFIISDRYVLITKAKCYISKGNYLEACLILNKLEEFTKLYERTYMGIEVKLLKAIICYRRNDNWQELLQEAILTASEYSFVQVLADHGAALLPLWKEMEWGPVQLESSYFNIVTRSIQEMANHYPSYLEGERKIDLLTSRETEVIRKIADGHTNSIIGEHLNLSISTVKYHIANIFRKLEVDNRARAVKEAKERNLI